MTASRLPSGGSRIDRSRTIDFEFDGARLEGFAGDTIASALLANGIDVVGRSIYHDRPRGIMTAGIEEPNALVQVTWPSGASEPMLRATTVPIEDGLRVEPLAGRGRLERPTAGDDAGRFDARHAHCEVLVVGAGESGLRAAAVARVSNPEDRILVLDADPTASGDGVIADTTALGIYDHGYVTAVQRRPTATTEGRLWRIRAGRIVIATGATERMIVFADDDRPGIMLAGAAATYVERYGVRPGQRAVIFTNNDTTDAVAATLAAAGVEIVATIDARRSSRWSGTPATTRGRLVAGRGPGTAGTIDADLLLVSGGWNPNVGLWAQARGRAPLRRGHRGLRAGPRPARSPRPDGGRRCGGRGDRGPRRDRADLGRAAGGRHGRDARRRRHERGRRRRLVDPLRRPRARRDRRRPAPSARRRPRFDRARQALHDHRHRHRAGPQRRGRRQRDRGRDPRPGGRRGRCPHVPPARPCPSASSSWRHATGARRWPTRSGSRRSSRGTWRTAPCSRTSASGSGRATSRATANRWTRPCSASAPRPGPGSRSWTRRRSARSTSRARTSARSWTACTRTRSRRSRSGRAATGSCARPTGWCSTTASRRGSATSGST